MRKQINYRVYDSAAPEQTGNEQTSELDNAQALEVNKRKRIAIYSSVTRSIIGIAVLFGVVLGKVMINILISNYR